MKKGTFVIRLMLSGTISCDKYPFEWTCGTALQAIGAYIAIRNNVLRNPVQEKEYDEMTKVFLDFRLKRSEPLMLDGGIVFINFVPTIESE